LAKFQQADFPGITFWLLFSGLFVPNIKIILLDYPGLDPVKKLEFFS
jgi:hypothetical protein